MNSLLGSGSWAYKDFEADKEMLRDYDGIFFWASRENGTSLAKIDFVQIHYAINESKNAEAN